MSKLLTRRQFIHKAGYTAAGFALLGCSSGDVGTTDSEATLWNRIPTQAWIVGIPVYIDLSDYVTVPIGVALTISIDKTLPEGVTINGSVISGTPTAVSESVLYVATADDGNG